MAKFGLKPNNHPIHLGWMGRKQATDFTSTTLQTWQRVIPDCDYKIRGGTEKTPKHILIRDSVAVDFGGLDRQESINKFNSAEYAFIAVDQAEETTKDDVSVLRASRRLTINGQRLDYKGLYTANPAQCWLKDEFIDQSKDRQVYVPALPTDNPHLPYDYVETLKSAFGHRPELLEGYLKGNWDCFIGADQVIKNAWIESARLLTLFPTHRKKIISCDPARFGDDETCIYVFENSKIVDTHVFGQKDTHYTSGFLNKLRLDNDNCPIIVDEIGVGGGIVDNLRAFDANVIAFNSAAKSTQPDRYYNLRAEAWDYVGKEFSDGNIEFKTDDRELVSQLCTPTYKFRNGKILLEAKDDIKKRIGRSPDRGDCYVMGIWGQKNVDAIDESVETESSSVTIPQFAS